MFVGHSSGIFSISLPKRHKVTDYEVHEQLHVATCWLLTFELSSIV